MGSTSDKFQENFNSYISNLINLIDEFQSWIREQFKYNELITILGI